MESKKVFLSWLSWCSSRTDGTDLVYTTGSTGVSQGNSDREYFVPSNFPRCGTDEPPIINHKQGSRV